MSEKENETSSPPTLEEVQAAIRKLDNKAAAIVAGRIAWRVMPLLCVKGRGFDYWPAESQASNLEAIQAAALAGMARSAYGSKIIFAAAAAAAVAVADAAASSAAAAADDDVADFAAFTAARAARAAAPSASASAAAVAAVAVADAAAAAAAAATFGYLNLEEDLLSATMADVKRFESDGVSSRDALLSIWPVNSRWEKWPLLDSWKSALLKLGPRGEVLWSRWQKFANGSGFAEEGLRIFENWLHDRKSGIERPAPSAPMPENTHIIPTLVGQDAVQSLEEDTLGYWKVATAVSRFIRNEDTSLPLTMSVEGEWGTGKSSFMGLLKEQLNTSDGEGFVTVWFNPWRYETVEAMWAGFAITMMEQLQTGLGKWEKCKIWWRLSCRRARQSWRGGRLIRSGAVVIGWAAIGLVVAGLLPVVESLFTDPNGPDKTWTDFWWFPVIAAVFSAGRKAFSLLGNPITEDLKVFFDEPNYAEQATVLQRFHTDLRHIMSTCVGSHAKHAHGNRKKIAVFIDDLDRCEVGVASEVLRSLNLFFATDQDESGNEKDKDKRPPMACFLGMDREKVAASIAAQHEKILPWMEHQTVENGKADRSDGLRFGYRYLEKFVHVTLMLPSPGEEQMTVFLDKLCGLSETKGAERQSSREITEAGKAPQPEAENDDGTDPGENVGGQSRFVKREDRANEEERELEAARKVAEEQETRLIRMIAEISAEALGFNPRRIKQFVNLFRLRISLAVELRIYRPHSSSPEAGEKLLTLEQIGKLVALELASPILILDIRKDPHFFESDSARSEKVISILQRPGVNKLINYVPEEDPWKWDLESVDLVRYSRIGLPTSGAMKAMDTE